jgi:hypothetical protein
LEDRRSVLGPKKGLYIERRLYLEPKAETNAKADGFVIDTQSRAVQIRRRTSLVSRAFWGASARQTKGRTGPDRAHIPVPRRNGISTMPAKMRFKADFYKMRLLCGDTELSQSIPARLPKLLISAMASSTRQMHRMKACIHIRPMPFRLPVQASLWRSTLKRTQVQPG